MRLHKKDFTLGALYRLGAERGFDRETLVRLMKERVGLSQRSAEQLAVHWLTTELFKRHHD